MTQPVLQVDNLSTHFTTPRGIVKAVNGVSFSVGRGEILGVVGESGSGKSQTGYSVMGLIDPPGKVVSGSIRLAGDELAGLNEAQWRKIRGNRIAMIFQDPMMTLNPVLRVDTQMIEAVLAHRSVSRRVALDEARRALAQVGIPAPDERLKCYPHQLSGGMRQRVAIAIALINRPEVVIADEPTTALDVTIQAQILGEIQQLCRDSGTALIWITHDLSVVAGLADRVCVMYGGRIAEYGSVDQVLDTPLHPYTQGLMNSIPSRNPKGVMLRQIPGAPPSLLTLGSGCAFRPRCASAVPECAQEIAVVRAEEGHMVRCIRPARELHAADVHQEIA
ncbi:ABC transporter ATP-binding protein [Paraburkholderia bonniea]|uniref:ABC transporter ATP-binding protein n=1 Tax=Paraburkholderia bonniea TaxID=2152891 RepID=UPI0012910714|nr:ABC transporter ATP-binding protein [Paraburkholderia bonniea]WJF91929.1 ABC transporter ATP-binding protein [Paraburkholderia bonniea]WJF95248.1 ABC transporter ATP-binding protein [Paraburkholderia bonniea]